MKSFLACLLALASYCIVSAQSSAAPINATRFFENEAILSTTIKTDLRALLSGKAKKGGTVPAQLGLLQENGDTVQEPVLLEPRGNFRRSYCVLPPLKIHFKTPGSPRLSPLGSLKLVNFCLINNAGSDYLLKEYLVYKIYNYITDKSLRVRLLKIQFEDEAGKKKSIDEYGFLIEDVSAMAKRNDCTERKRDIGHTESTDRAQMTRVALFEYMIGNLDWSVPGRHNIKLIVPKNDTAAVPYAVPYDFDYSGLVKADYAVPPPELNLENVTVRDYRGFARSYDELQVVAAEFIARKAAIYKMIREFELLSKNVRSEMITYLEEFYKTLSQPSQMKVQFIENARRN